MLKTFLVKKMSGLILWPKKNTGKKIIVKKTGIGSDIYEFANSNAATYGVFVIIFSILSGLIAATLFRRV